MTRRVFPEDGDVRRISSTGGMQTAAGLPAVVYTDSAGTVLADIHTYPGDAPVAGSTLTVDSASCLPLFYGPDTATDTLYVSVSGGPVTPIYVRVDDRLDQLEAAPPAHASRHATAGADPLTPSAIGAQPADANLTAIAALATTGLISRSGEGTAATVVTGTTAGTVAAGDDSRFIASGDIGYDIIIAAGQSNMFGHPSAAPDPTRLDPTDPRIYQFAQSGTAGYLDVISLAVEPLSHIGTGTPPTGMGPAFVFARWYASTIPDNRRVLILPMGVSTTKISDPAEWDPAGTPGNLYYTTIAKANLAVAAAGDNARVVAMLWLQGESDAMASYSGTLYAAKLDALIAGWRAAITGATSCPFVICGMVPELLSGTSNAVREAHIATPRRVSYTGFCAGPYGMHIGDSLHYTAPAQRLNGENMFYAYLDAQTNLLTGTVPPKVDSLVAAMGTTSATLSWTPTQAEPPITNYVVEYKLSSSPTWTTLSGTLTAAAVAVERLALASSYDFRVTAVNATGTGTASDVTTASTSAISGAFVVDNFADVEGTDLTAHTPEVGGAWSRKSGTSTFTITDANTAVLYGTDGATLWRNTVVPVSADCTVSMTIVPASITDTEVGPIVRLLTSSDTYIYTCASGSTSMKWYLIQKKNGSLSVLASSGTVSGGFSPSDSYTITLQATGTTVTSKVQRASDSQWLTSLGAWQVAEVAALTGTTTVTALGYAGIFGGKVISTSSVISNYVAHT